MVRGHFKDIRPFVYGIFCKKFRQNHKKTCLIFPEQDQSTKTNLRMFKFDKKLIIMGTTRAHNMTSQVISKTKWFEIKYAPLQKTTFNCLSLFCFINFITNHDFSKQVSFCTLFLKSLKQTIKKKLIRFSHSVIHMHRDYW